MWLGGGENVYMGGSDQKRVNPGLIFVGLAIPGDIEGIKGALEVVVVGNINGVDVEDLASDF